MLKIGPAGFNEKERAAYAGRHGLAVAVAGVPFCAPAPGSSLEGVRMCAKLGLPAMEVEFVHGVHMKDGLAKEVGAEAGRLNVSLSVHAPYFINLCSDDELKMKNTHRHILQSAQAAHFLHATPAVFHPGFYQGRTKAECEKRAKKELQVLLERMASLGLGDVVLGAELTGKKSAYGDLDEIIELARHFGLGKLQPVIDFGHYHARIGRIRTKEDYEKILDRMENALGSEYRRRFHCHYSEIQFTDAGEGKHLPIGSDGPPYQPLLEALHERKYEGTIVCESPKLEEDALVMWKAYGRMAKK